MPFKPLQTFLEWFFHQLVLFPSTLFPWIQLIRHFGLSAPGLTNVAPSGGLWPVDTAPGHLATFMASLASSPPRAVRRASCQGPPGACPGALGAIGKVGGPRLLAAGGPPGDGSPGPPGGPLHRGRSGAPGGLLPCPATAWSCRTAEVSGLSPRETSSNGRILHHCISGYFAEARRDWAARARVPFPVSYLQFQALLSPGAFPLFPVKS